MWFKLAGATFSNNLGTMESISKSYMMDYSGLTGLSATPANVSYATNSTPDATITFTVKEGYVLKSGSVVSASGGAAGTYTASSDIAANTSFEMALTEINGKVVFSGTAERISSSSGGDTSGGETYTLTINPTPSDAIVIINNVVQNTASIGENSSVNWSVSKTGYEIQSGVWTATEDTTMNIELVENTSGSMYPVILTASDLTAKKGFDWTAAYPGTKTQTTRLSYIDFDLLVDTTKKYTITYTTNSDSVIMMGVHAWDTVADEIVQAQSGTFAKTNTNRTGWESSGYSFLGSITSEAGNPIVGFRISFGKGASGTETLDGTEVTSVTIIEEDV